jgi:hypothetical protein
MPPPLVDEIRDDSSNDSTMVSGDDGDEEAK